MIIDNQRILIFGGTGSLGKKLIYRLKERNNIHVYSRDEEKHWTIKNELQFDKDAGNVSFHVGDVRDKNRIKNVLSQTNPQIIIIASALKHVDTCELTPYESIQTNIIGTQNIIDAVNEQILHSHYTNTKVLFVSTDKSCCPINVYGMCKAISERIVTSQKVQHRALFIATRYGNVLESRGSIIPLFKFQAENKPYLTVTDPNMTRFMMTLDQSVDLIIHTLNKARPGETWVPKLPSMRIGDLAEIFSEKYNKPIKIVGLRPGEKMHEDLVSESESRRIRIPDKNHYAIKSSLERSSDDKEFVYSSNHDVVSKQQLNKYLNSLGIIDWSLDMFTGKNIEEIKT